MQLRYRGCCVRKLLCIQQYEVIVLRSLCLNHAAMFLDSAVQAVSEGGMLAVTCTDMAVGSLTPRLPLDWPCAVRSAMRGLCLCCCCMR